MTSKEIQELMSNIKNAEDALIVAVWLHATKGDSFYKQFPAGKYEKAERVIRLCAQRMKAENFLKCHEKVEMALNVKFSW